MRTVGEILKQKRVEKNISLEAVEKQIKIRSKFLIALEDNDWKAMPSLPYIKGFLRNYSLFLGLNPSDTLAIFRRQFTKHESSSLLPNGVSNPLNKPIFTITPQKMVISAVTASLIIFFTYLFFQYKAITGPPNLIISTPKEGEVIKSESITISGKTDPDAVLSINNQKIATSENGNFNLALKFPPDKHTIIFEAVSKYGKSKIINRTIQVEYQQ